mmetsp:Transcript_4244/g.14783  ORF Transcript_4244/g.14783 Transcript_4244/m.14783 type:complete len:203 (-) Transcript_4244:636-1244(-)
MNPLGTSMNFSSTTISALPPAPAPFAFLLLLCDVFILEGSERCPSWSLAIPPSKESSISFCFLCSPLWFCNELSSNAERLSASAVTESDNTSKRTLPLLAFAYASHGLYIEDSIVHTMVRVNLLLLLSSLFSSLKLFVSTFASCSLRKFNIFSSLIFASSSLSAATVNLNRIGARLIGNSLANFGIIASACCFADLVGSTEK